MPSATDGESVLSSGNDRPGPASPIKARHPTAPSPTTVGKGILVHNNKRSVNTNRVSFVTSQPKTTSLSPLASVKQQPQSKVNHLGDDQTPPPPHHTWTGGRLASFGVKSHLHEFYDNPEDRQSPFQDDDFEYFVEPEIQWHGHCSGVYAVLGLVIMLTGAGTMAAGHLLPAKDPMVDRTANLEVIDKWAVAYNDNLATCRYVGSVVFAVGVLFTVVRFWTSVMTGGGRAKEKKLSCDQRNTPAEQRPRQVVRIPITGSVENVQPDPRTISLRVSKTD